MNRITDNIVIKSFVKSHQDYKGSFELFEKLDKKTKEEITEHLVQIESKSSVEIEELNYAK
jgi:hypothetical protein